MKRYLRLILFFVLIFVVSFGVTAGILEVKIKHFTESQTKTILSQPENPVIPENNVPSAKETQKELPTSPTVSTSDLATSSNEVPPQASNESLPSAIPANIKACKSENSNGQLVGPRGNVPKGAPKEAGFSDFAISVPGFFGRSGRTTKNDLLWLKSQGWKAIVNMTLPGEHGGKDDDTLISGFSALGFHYINIPVASGYAPSQKQAETFLAFVTDPVNQPVLVHCSAGHGRAGTMSVLYRYSVQGWSLDKAIEEFKLFDTDGIDARQKSWLESWAAQHTPGSYACPTTN